MLASPLPPLIAVLALLWPARRRLAGTTLIAPWAWSIAATAFWAAIELWFTDSSEIRIAPWRYLATAGTLCPMIAVMGAKRPQDRGWQWIVLSLWIVLAIPVAQHQFFRSGQQFSLFAAWLVFLAVLLALELLNYLPTRHAGSALLVAAAQCCLLGDSLGWKPWGEDGATVAAWLVLIAVALAWILHRHSAPPVTPTDQWLQFRNAFGAFWALRVLQRVNQTAEVQGWPVRLEWSGFRELPNRTDAPPAAEVEQCLHTLLRRFVLTQESASDHRINNRL